MKKTLKIRHVKLAPIIGFGCWKDDYKNTMPEGGYCWNIILLCIRIQVGEIYYIDPKDDTDNYEFDFGGILKTR